MKMKAKMMAIGLVLAMVFCYAGSTLADEMSGTGPASASLDFKVVIADYLEFRVGSIGTGNIDEITFQPTQAQIDAGSIVSASSGGDLGAGVVTVRLLTNTTRDIIVEEVTQGTTGLVHSSDPLSTIDYANIVTTDTGSGLTPPQLSNSATNTTTLTGGVHDITTNWTYTFEHAFGSKSIKAGDYLGRVTYTISSP